TYAELETAMFDQSELIWRDLSGLDPTARKEFRLTGEVVGYWQARCRAERELRGRLQPALTQMNREIYRRARESSVRGAFGRLEEILADEGRTLVAIIALALVAGLVASWVISQ